MEEIKRKSLLELKELWENGRVESEQEAAIYSTSEAEYNRLEQQGCIVDGYFKFSSGRKIRIERIV